MKNTLLAKTDLELVAKAHKTSFVQKETKRQRVAREFAMQKAGLPLPTDTELERRRGKVVADGIPKTLHQELRTSSGVETARCADSASDDESSESGTDERMAAHPE